MNDTVSPALASSPGAARASAGQGVSGAMAASPASPPAPSPFQVPSPVPLKPSAPAGAVSAAAAATSAVAAAATSAVATAAAVAAASAARDRGNAFMASGAVFTAANGPARATAAGGSIGFGGLLLPPGISTARAGGGGASASVGLPFPGPGPSRKRLDSEEFGFETTPRGTTPTGTPGGKRRRRDGTDIAGHRMCVFKLTAQENVGFMDRLRDLYDTKELCDVTLRVEGEEFRAHKAVLACSKSFLGALMRAGMMERDQDVIDLQDISARQFKILLDYMYNKPISVPSSHMVDLLSLANQYQVEGLKEQMCTALSKHLNHDNACSVFAAADSHHCEILKEEAFSKIVQHFALATRSDGWLALNKDQLSEVLSSDQVLDCDESVVFDAASRWLLAPSESPPRQRHAPEVLEMVRFPLMDAGLLSDVIKDHEVTKGPECQKLIAEAWEHHALKAVGREGLTGTPRTKQRRRSCSFKKHTLLTEHQDAVSALAVVNGKLVSGSWDTSIKVWDPQSWTTERTLSDHTGPVRCFAQCAGRLLSGSDDSTIKVWNTDTWSVVRSLDDHTDVVNALTDCEGRLASGSDDGTIKLWNTANWQCEVTIHQADHTCGVLALATCGDFLVSGSDGGIKVWNTHNWTCHKDLVLGQGDEIWALAVVGDRLVSGSIDSTIRVWETQTWGCEKKLEDHRGPVYALTVLEGKLVSASSDHTIRVWGPDWACCRTLECSGVWSLNVFNDRLVSGSLDNAVKVWGA
eukprot:g4580.t1